MDKQNREVANTVAKMLNNIEGLEGTVISSDKIREGVLVNDSGIMHKMSTPVLRVMVGLPRSGKSTYVQNQPYPGWVIVSADEIRKLVYGQRFWLEGEDLVWAIRKIFLKLLMSQNKDIIIDETNTTKARRAGIIKLGKKYGYKINAIWVKTEPDTCIQRAFATNSPSLVPVITEMSERFEEPTTEEGFDSVTVMF